MIPPAPTPSKGSALPVPLSALAIDNVAPAVGDETEVPLKIKIDRIEGETAYVTPIAINGESISMGAAEPDDDDMNRLAEEADEEAMPA